MGAWGTGAFDNDAACDWTSDLTEVDDLSLVEGTLSVAEEVDDDELDAGLGCEALAACEVVARLQGRTGRKLDPVDSWVRAHPMKPSPALVRLATNVIDRVATGSELAQQWAHDRAWRAGVKDLRKRLTGPQS
ncbi:MAG TPA: DUF4259 domain-containing protein [Kofleriaceae bacterium]|nr:DUF4259 domain-containing protein [Kofleriaceae bacterium]